MAFALYSLLYTGANTFLEDEKKFILHCTHVSVGGIIAVNFTYTKRRRNHELNLTCVMEWRAQTAELAAF
jgi:hypothetical protein